MRQRAGKSIKSYGMIICLATLVLFFCVAGSYAAYTNFSSAKRVVSAQSQAQTFFVSNMLYIEDRGTESIAYQRKRIVLNENNEITFDIYNYYPGNTAVYCNRDITYKLNATLLSETGSPDNYKILYGNEEYSFSAVSNGALQLTLSGNQLSTHSFQLVVPDEEKDQIRICVEAIPDDASYEITNQKKLAVVFMTGEVIGQKTWSGKFLDELTNHVPNDYDGFNYEISGNGEGTVTLEWDPEILTISPWFVSQTHAVTVSDGAIQFAVGGKDQPSAYQTQFYKAVNWDPAITKQELQETITVYFSEQDHL